MTSLALSFGCALVAFCPSLTLFFLLVNRKTHLTIIAIISAFFHLLSVLISSIFYLPLRLLNRDNAKNKLDWLYIMLTSIALQTVCRYFLVKLYRIVEAFLLSVLEKGREDQDHPNSSERRTYRFYENKKIHINNSSTGLNNIDPVVQLKLELNDVTCALASGIGFGGMHAVILYGTLLVSQVHEKGTLFQPSCERFPSLIPTAVITCLFSILDVIWMLIFFYGIRKKGTKVQNHQAKVNLHFQTSQFQVSGRSAILAVIFSHTLASISTVMNKIIPNNGCLIVLSCLFVVVVATIAFFWIFIKNWYTLKDTTEKTVRYCKGDHSLKKEGPHEVPCEHKD